MFQLTGRNDTSVECTHLANQRATNRKNLPSQLFDTNERVKHPESCFGRLIRQKTKSKNKEDGAKEERRKRNDEVRVTMVVPPC